MAAIAKASSVAPGEMAAFDVDGTRVAVANVNGTFYAFGDTCTHLQCSLAKGHLEGTTVTCSCHGSQFDVVTGSVLRPPAREPVKSYRLAVEGENIKIES